MNSPAIMARRSYLEARCNLVIVHSHCAGREGRIDIGEYRSSARIFRDVSSESFQDTRRDRCNSRDAIVRLAGLFALSRGYPSPQVALGSQQDNTFCTFFP